MFEHLKNSLFLLLATVSLPLAAAPVAYSINSDSPTESTADSLYRIDLANGNETRVGRVTSQGRIRIDVEGLAFAPDGTLYGVDDDSLTLFPLNPDTGMVQSASEVQLKGLPIGGKNDFGMTFACDGSLYVTSVTRGSLYRVSLNGTTQLIGAEGSLGPVKISALAAWGSPVRLYGLGNGSTSAGAPDTPNLYEIDLANGTANLVGALGGQAAQYLEGGLAFDDSGQLWAITDRSQFDQPSQLLKIDHNNGLASEPRTLGQVGYESLAITIPRGCQDTGGGDVARFTVEPQYLDGNDVTPVTLTIECQTGLPLTQSISVLPSPQSRDVTFTVTAFQEGALDCEIREEAPAGYTPAYSCFSTGNCGAGASGCSFVDVTSAQENLCTVRNTPNPVNVQVSKEWVDSRESIEIPHVAKVELFCKGLLGGDGTWDGSTMQWSWPFDDNNIVRVASVQPRYDGSTYCRTEETIASSAVESANSCENWTQVPLGAGSVACSLVNTLFFEGIPTLQPLGLALGALLLLITGLFAARRF